MTLIVSMVCMNLFQNFIPEQFILRPYAKKCTVIYNTHTLLCDWSISNEYRRTEEQNKKCLLQVIDAVKLLARQGLPFRGNLLSSCEFNSNFHQLLLLQAKRDPDLAEWMKKTKNKYTSNTSQNGSFSSYIMGEWQFLYNKGPISKAFNM